MKKLLIIFIASALSVCIVDAQIPTNGLVAYYPFTNGSTSDWSGNGNNGTNNGATITTNRFGNANSAYHFDGDDFIRVNDTNSLDLSTSFTFSLWVQLDAATISINDIQSLISKWSDTEAEQAYTFEIAFPSNPQVNARTGPSTTFRQPAQNNIAIHNWHHLVVTYDNSNIRHYIDGLLDKTSAQTGQINSGAEALTFGAHDVNVATRRWLFGSLDDIRIYNRALSESEIQELYHESNLTVTSPTGGENWNVGTWHSITWEKSSDITSINLDYSTDNGMSWNPIVTLLTPVVNSYPWIVNGSPSSQCLIRISDATNPAVTDISDNPFIIGEGPRIRISIINNSSEVISKVRLSAPFLNRDKVWNGLTPIVFDGNDLLALKSDVNAPISTEAKLLRNDNSVCGHMPFNYTQADYDAGRQIDLYLAVHDYETGWYSAWNYFKDGNEKMVSMLIPPFRSIDLINYNKPPLLLVHGVNGTYPYWDKDDRSNHNSVDELSQDYDAWQFYYPYDQYIDKSALLLRDALQRILDNPGPNGQGSYPNGTKMNIVAHSMGGLVTRSYIQSNEYEGNIRKLLMLGTPNHGTYTGYRIAYAHDMTDEIKDLFFGGHTDDQAPAYSEMTPGGNFLISLNDQAPKILNNEYINQKAYLVLAGTEDIAPVIHEEISKQDDGVVSVSSASLLDYQIPLATITYGHVRLFGKKGLTVDVEKALVYRFLSDEYVPTNNNEPLIQMVNGFWRGFDDNPKSDISSGFDKNKGIITMRIPDVNKKIESFHFIKDGNTLIARSQRSLLELQRHDEYLRRIEDTDNFFSLDNELLNQIGLSFEEADYTIQFQERKGLGWRTIASFPNALPFHHLATTMARVNLLRGQLTIINSDGEISPTMLPLAGSSRLMYLLKRQTKMSTSTQQSLEYIVDASIDSLTFLLNGDEDEINFQFHNMKLEDPDGIIIDSTYAQNDTTMEFLQDIDLKFAYYFVSKPKQGTWKVLYDTSLHHSEVVAPVASTINLSTILSDSIIARGDSVSFAVVVNSPTQPSGINIECRLYQSTGNGDTLLLISTLPVSSSPDSNSFTGKFFAEQSGEFLIGVEYSASISGQPVFRNSLTSLFVNELVAPQLLYPGNGQQNIGHNLKLKWHSANNAESYSLTLFALGDSVPFIEQSNITDTTFDVVGLLDSVSYYWQIQSMSSADTSSWSELRNFKTVGNVCLKVSKGWNLISIPVRKSTLPKEEIFSPSASNAFRYLANVGYQVSDSLVHSIGYWLKFSDTATFCMLGLPLATDTVSLSSGWNLIGSLSTPLATSTVTSNPGGIITSAFFGYNGAYFETDTIIPGKGYWVNVNQAGQLILSSSSSAISASNRIKIVPTNELPPSPPDGQTSNLKPLTPNQFVLEQNYPNPFNPSTAIKFELPTKSRVKLEIFNTLGQRVASLVNEVKEAGYYHQEWNAQLVSSGLYFYRIEAVDVSNPANAFTQVKKMLMIK